MKTFTILASLFVLGSGAAFAQADTNFSANTVAGTTSTKTQTVAHDVTGFTNPNTGPSVVNNPKRNAQPNMHPDLKPAPGGIVTDTVKYGAVLYSPTAPAEYGNGEQYLSAPSSRTDLQHESGPAAHRDSGGFKLFSLEF